MRIVICDIINNTVFEMAIWLKGVNDEILLENGRNPRKEKRYKDRIIVLR